MAKPVYKISVPWTNLNEFQAFVLLEHPKAMAKKWIEGYADNLSGVDYDNGYQEVTYGELVETALQNLNASEEAWDEYICKGGLFEGERVDPTFWDKLSILCDIEIPYNDRNSFFTCSC